jgi:hypothetical protein
MKGPGMVVHICNLSYFRGRDQEDCSSRSTQAKKLAQDPFSTKNKLGIVAHAYNPNYAGGIVGESLSEVRWRKNKRPYLEK